MKIKYKPSFVRHYNKLGKELQEEVLDTIELLKSRKNYKKLKVHKLKGRLKQFYSCSVNYRYRIIFNYESRKDIVLHVVGDHSAYN